MRTIYLELSRDFLVISLFFNSLGARGFACAVSGVGYIFSCGFASPAGGLWTPKRNDVFPPAAREKKTSGTQGISLIVSSLISKNTIFEFGLDLTIKNI